MNSKIKLHKPITVISDMGTKHLIYHWFTSDEKANLFLEANEDYGVLCVRGKRIYLEKLTNRGIKC
jgi:hypothetical protein